MQVSRRSDFCVGYLNLRGWQAIDDLIAPWDPATGQVCRVLVGMQRPPHEEIRELYRQTDESGVIDNATASRLKTQFAAHLREQITLGIPSGQDEAGLRRFARQLRAGQVVVKLFLPYPLHAKLYLLFRDENARTLTPKPRFTGAMCLTTSCSGAAGLTLFWPILRGRYSRRMRRSFLRNTTKRFRSTNCASKTGISSSTN